MVSDPQPGTDERPRPTGDARIAPDEAAPAASWIEDLRNLMTFDEAPIAREISEGIASSSSLRDLVWRANHDPLTMLANRRWFLQCAESSRTAPGNAGHSHVLVLLDLDDFKSVNDTHGHAAGDAVLTEISRRLRSISRQGDVVARLGGDEFAIWIERVGAGTAKLLGARYLAVFDRAIPYNDESLRVSGSMGVVASDGDSDIDELLELADSALYEAKAEGTGQIRLYDHILQAKLEETIRRQRQLGDAIVHDQFEFDVQPIVSLADGEAIGYEVLSRWQSPDGVRVMPGDFLPDLVAANLTKPFDAMVIEKAARSVRRWRYGLRPPGSIWVNISPNQLEMALPTMVEDIMSRHNIEPGELVFELNEDAAANTPSRIAVLRSLRELGIGIAIDDFGTGHSQLAYLHNLPVDFVKLDRSFIDRFDEDERRAAITKSVILLAQALGAEVVAEGVERSEELELLRELGCNHVQGYLLARPGDPVQMLGI